MIQIYYYIKIILRINIKNILIKTQNIGKNNII